MKLQKNPVAVAIIPARFASTRFPGKPLIEIHGKTLIQHTYENAKRCQLFNEIIVATDDKRIFEHVKSFGGNVTMTPEQCPTGTDRLAFVVENERALQQAEMIINIQGDEPCLDPAIITNVIEILRFNPAAVMSTAVTPLKEEEAQNPSNVKCILSPDGTVLYFSRALIPGGLSLAYRKNIPYYKHLGIYAYRPDFLLQYTKLPMTPLQMAEDLEQLKVLEHGYKIKAAVVRYEGTEVNTPEDIKKVEQALCIQNSFS